MLADPEELKGGETWGSLLSQQCSSVTDGTRGVQERATASTIRGHRWLRPGGVSLSHWIFSGACEVGMTWWRHWCHWCHSSQKCSMRSYWKPASCHWFCQQLRALKRRHLCSLSLAVRLKFPYITKHWSTSPWFWCYIHSLQTFQRSKTFKFGSIFQFDALRAFPQPQVPIDIMRPVSRCAGQMVESFGQRVKVRFKSFLVPVQDPDLKKYSTIQHKPSSIHYFSLWMWILIFLIEDMYEHMTFVICCILYKYVGYKWYALLMLTIDVKVTQRLKVSMLRQKYSNQIRSKKKCGSNAGWFKAWQTRGCMGKLGWNVWRTCRYRLHAWLHYQYGCWQLSFH